MAKNGNGRIRWKHFAFFFHLQKHHQMSLKFQKTNDDTNVQYSENIHKEDSQPQFPENNSDLDTIDTECEETKSQNPAFIDLATIQNQHQR